MSSPGSSLQIKCPRCGTLTIFASTNPSRPFCSDRCRLIDLGQWANEDFRIPHAVESGPSLELSSGLNDDEIDED